MPITLAGGDEARFDANWKREYWAPPNVYEIEGERATKRCAGTGWSHQFFRLR